MSLPNFLTESPSPAFIQSADNSVNLPTDETSDANKEAERLERVRYCMTKRKIRNPNTGRMEMISIPCNVWQLCPRCFMFRMEEFCSRVDLAVHAGPVRQMLVTTHEAIQIVRKYGKEKIFGIPQEGDMKLVFVETSDDIGQPVESAVKLNWREIARTPEGRHLSGHMGKKPPKENIEYLKSNAYVIENLSETEQDAADKEAIAATANLDPKTLYEVESAIDKRDKVYLAAIRRRGGKVAFQSMFFRKVVLEDICWKITSLSPSLHSNRTHSARSGRHKVLIQ